MDYAAGALNLGPRISDCTERQLLIAAPLDIIGQQ